MLALFVRIDVFDFGIGAGVWMGDLLQDRVGWYVYAWARKGVEGQSTTRNELVRLPTW